MTQDDSLPLITTDFDADADKNRSLFYRDLIRNILVRILPSKFSQLFQLARIPQKQNGEMDCKPGRGDILDPEGKMICEKYGLGLHNPFEELNKYLQTLLPLTSYSQCGEEETPNISFFVLSRCRSGSYNFAYDMFSRWLVPGKRLNVLLTYCVDFSLPQLSNTVYTVTEVVIRPENQEELEAVLRNWPIIESELCLGVESSYYSRKILEVKGLTSDRKTAMIQEYIGYLTWRWPQNFSYDVFTEMQHSLVMCRDDFKALREVRHLSRIICIQYLFRKLLRGALKDAPQKRHLSLKIFKAKLQFPDHEKTVLGVIVAVNFLRGKEAFEETHLIEAVRNYIPDSKAVENTFIFTRRGNEPICTLYLEIEKNSGEEFTHDEIQILRKELPSELEGRIEHLMHSVFMPRNEEEVMRNILTLSNQIKYLRDIPQMFISFDEQTHRHLFFTVVLVRVIKPGSLSVQEMFNSSDTILDYVHDRCKSIGYIRKKYLKEATVFRIKISKNQFLRRDYSIDLYKARHTVVSEISSVVGEVRDYNGGMISKQNELLNLVKGLLKGTKKYNDLLLENFFYSLNPVIMRTVLEPEALKKLFLILLESVSEGFLHDESYSMKIRAEPSLVYVVIAAEDHLIDEEVKRVMGKIQLSSTDLATSCVLVYNTPYFGYIYRSEDPLEQRRFCVAIQHAVEACELLKAKKTHS